MILLLAMLLPFRVQCDLNHGYCGETSFQVAGLYYGEYASQYAIREMGKEGSAKPQTETQVLIGPGTNAAIVAEALHLKIEENSGSFLSWMKRHVEAGHPVIIGLYLKGGSDPDYDHIVVVDDFIAYSDNGLATDEAGQPIFRFTADPVTFTRTREEANRADAPLYSLPPDPHGIAILGRSDSTLPITVTASLNYEPDIAKRSEMPPAPLSLTLTATVAIKDQSKACTITQTTDGIKTAEWRIPARSGPIATVTVQSDTGKTVVFSAE